MTTETIEETAEKAAWETFNRTVGKRQEIIEQAIRQHTAPRDAEIARQTKRADELERVNHGLQAEIERMAQQSKERGEILQRVILENNELAALDGEAQHGYGEMQRQINELKTQLAANPTDNHDLDGTDAAHPAWWRGHDNGARGVTELIERVLDGKDDCSGKSAYAPLQAVRERVKKLVEGKK